MDKIAVLLADDHVLMREGTRQLLECNANFEVVAEADDGLQAVELAAEWHPDVILMDIAMPKLNGIEATKQIKAICPAIAILILTAYDDDQYVFALLEAGAAGYLLKDVRSRDLIEAIRAVNAGESVLHPVIARKVVNRFALHPDEPSDENALDQLTQREMEVLRLAAKGMSNREIAQELVLSVRTVQGHLHSVFEKIRVGSRTEAVLYGLRKGWLTLEDTG